MPLSKSGSRWWRAFFDLASDDSADVIDFLCRRYVEETQRVERFKQHAERMHYPQYRDKLLEMAKEKGEHAERIGKKIVSLGGRLPDVRERRSTDENSWQSLSMVLEEENRSADGLPETLRSIASEHPDIAQILEQISREQEYHRGAIRDMLMRSDAFAQSLA